MISGLSLLLVTACSGTSHDSTAADGTPVRATSNAPVHATPHAPVHATPHAPVHATSHAPVHATPKASPTASTRAVGTSSATPTTNPPAVAAPEPGTWWHPAPSGPNSGPEFQWELDHALNVQSTSDMGYAAANAVGGKASDPAVYDIDGIDNSASAVSALHRLNDKVICYVEVGAAGNYYSAADEGIPVTYYAQLKAAGDLGSSVPGYPEYYLNISAASTARIIEAMIQQQCAAKGFDAVEPDIDDSYTDATGFQITETMNIEYDKMLGAYAHSLGLAWGQKNGDNDPQFAASLEPTTDFLLDEECNFYQTCAVVTSPYVQAGKLVLDAEYTDDWGNDTAKDLAQFCTYDLAHGIDGTLFTTALAGQRDPCR